MVGSVKCANVIWTFFFFGTDFPVLFTPPKRTRCMPTPVALTTLPALWPAGCPWKLPRSWRKLRPVWQLWQWMWKMATPLLFWETAEEGCTRYDLHAAKRIKLTRGAQVKGEKGSFSLGSWVSTKDRYYQMVFSHPVLPVENVNAPNVVTLALVTPALSQQQGWCILHGLHRYFWACASRGWSHCTEVLVGD